MESFEDLFRDESDYLQQLAEYQAEEHSHLLNFLPDSRDPDVARLSYYESAANFANQQSTLRLKEKLQELWSPQ